MREIELGPCAEPTRIYRFVAQDEAGTGAPWYELDYSTTPPKRIAVALPGLRGYITGIRVSTKTSEKYGDKAKVDIFMDAGERSYAIRSGITTTFTRGIVLSLLAIDNPETLKDLLTITVKPGKENSKTVLGSVYITRTGKQIVFSKADWDKDTDMSDPISILQSILTDGGQGDHEPDEAEGHEQPPANTANEKQVNELKRCGVVAGLAHKLEGEDLDISELQRECARLYPGKTIETLDRAEAIEFRKTLLAI